MFNQTKIDLGYCISNKKYHAKYPYKDIVKILKVEMSCDCLSYDNEVKFNRLIITWTPKPVPVHLREQKVNHYSTTKTITVTFADSNNPDLSKIVVLSFDAKVID